MKKLVVFFNLKAAKLIEILLLLFKYFKLFLLKIFFNKLL